MANENPRVEKAARSNHRLLNAIFRGMHGATRTGYELKSPESVQVAFIRKGSAGGRTRTDMSLTDARFRDSFLRSIYIHSETIQPLFGGYMIKIMRTVNWNKRNTVRGVIQAWLNSKRLWVAKKLGCNHSGAGYVVLRTAAQQLNLPTDHMIEYGLNAGQVITI